MVTAAWNIREGGTGPSGDVQIIHGDVITRATSLRDRPPGLGY